MTPGAWYVVRKWMRFSGLAWQAEDDYLRGGDNDALTAAHAAACPNGPALVVEVMMWDGARYVPRPDLSVTGW